MRARVYANNALRLEKSYQQPAPVPGEALIRVTLAGICNTDLELTKKHLRSLGSDRFTWAHLLYGRLDQVRAILLKAVLVLPHLSC